MTKETQKLVLQMSVGTFLWNVLLGVAGFFLGPALEWSRMSIGLGLLAGFLSAEAMLIHMAVITERVLESRNEAYANKTTVIHSMGRKLVYILALGLILWRIPQINAMAMVLGTMGLKAGAYLQPVLFGRNQASGRTEELEQTEGNIGERRNAYGDEYGNPAGS